MDVHSRKEHRSSYWNGPFFGARIMHNLTLNNAKSFSKFECYFFLISKFLKRIPVSRLTLENYCLQNLKKSSLWEVTLK